MIEALAVAQMIDTKAFNEQFEGKDTEPSFHSKLVSELCRRGWKEYNTHSQCKVAYGGENHMQKDGRKVEIITSSFMGTFTLVNTF